MSDAPNISLAAESAHPVQAQVVRCASAARELRMALGLGARQGNLRASVLELVQSALRVCDAAEESFSAASDDDASSGSDVADVAFVSRSELRASLPGLMRVSGPHLEPSECARALRRVHRVLTALDVALATALGTKSTLEADDGELSRSIATRKHYARVRRAILGFGMPTNDAELAKALARVNVHLRMLVASEVYAALRMDDKERIDDLFARVRTASQGSVSPSEAMRLWQDLIGFARLSMAINRRHELVENDTRIVIDAVDRLQDATEIAPRLRARLDTLEGFDDELDQLLEARDWSIRSWLSVLDILHDRLVQPSSSGFLLVREVSDRFQAL